MHLKKEEDEKKKQSNCHKNVDFIVLKMCLCVYYYYEFQTSIFLSEQDA